MLDRFVRTFSRIAGALAILAGVLALIGWFSGLSWPPRLVQRDPRMTADTAIMSVLAGAALWAVSREPCARRSRWIAWSCALAICAIAGLTELEYAIGIRFGIDQLLPYAVGPWPPGRPSPQTAASFLALGTGLLAIDRSIRGRRPADYLALAAILLATGALLGYLFRAPAMDGFDPYIGMSIPTALVVLGLGLGLIAARIDRSVLAIVLARDAGGAAARRLLGGMLVLLPVVVVLLAGAHAGWYTFAFASSLVLLIAVAEASAMILSTAKRLGRADAALRAAEARVRVIVEQASDAIFIADPPEGRYTEVNDAACRMLGCARDELVGKTILDLIPPEDAPRLAASTARLVAGETDMGEWQLRRCDGTYLPVEVSAKVLADGRWQGIVRDITERKRAEAATARLYEAEIHRRAWLESLIDQLPEGVIVLDESGKVAAMNRVMRTFAVPDPASTEPRDSPARFDLRDRDLRPVPLEDRPAVRALRRGETTRGGEYLLPQTDGRMLPITANAGPVRDERQHIIGSVSVVTDASERKEIERTREEWIAVVAHDLRQPLNSILLWSDRLIQLAISGPQRAAIERLRGAGWLLDRMIGDLLDAARITANQLAIEPRAADVVELARAAIDNARLASPSTELRLEAPESALAWVDGDRIQQVLGNLISNAVKYGAPGTPIRIEIASRNGEVELAVVNAGREITAGELPRLFSRFSRTPEARTARIPGIGLGLYICKGLVEAHGGRIWAESGGGMTAFRFTLPRPPE